MNLIIVESPTKSRTLSRFLGKGYRVDATIGHIKDLPKSTIGVDVKNKFAIDYRLVADKEATVASIVNDSLNADTVYLATDPDREGEAIAAHVREILLENNKIKKKRKKGKKNFLSIKRIVFHEITKEAVDKAMKHPRRVDTNLVRAQEARRVLDRLVGYTLSPLLWKKVRYGLSAGRVQSAALRILMEREREVRAFVPEGYYVIIGTFVANGKTFPLVCDLEPREIKEAERIIRIAKKRNWKIVSVKETEVKRNPYPPFITSTLQRTASSRFGFSPSRTMRAAQRLYEAGRITYMRTDSTYISKGAQKKILSLAKKEYGPEYVQERFFKTKSKNAQEAHEAIRPTKISSKLQISASKMSGDQRRLYDLIWKRTIASQMTPARLKRTKVSANVDGDNIPNFSTVGSRILFDGWFRVDGQARKEDVEVPALAKEDKLKLKKIEREDKQTQPPNRYTEAGLIKELETRGIGRPSTYASITRTIENRGYVEKEGKTLIPTDTGDVVSSFLEKHFAKYISDTFTAEMENELDDVAKGKVKYEKLLADFYKPFGKDVKAKEKVDKLTNLGKADKKFKCRKCGKGMVIKLGKTGKFLSCSTYPDCDGALTIEGKVLGVGKALGKHPKSGESIYLLKGRFGPYVQLGKKTDDNTNPKRASVPKDKLENLSLDEAVHLLKLPRELGEHPKTGEMVIANIGRFGPYVGHGREFRSLRKPDNPYTVNLKRAVEILNKPKALPKGVQLVKVLGNHPKTGNEIRLLRSKSGLFVQKGLKRYYLGEDEKRVTLEKAVEVMK